MATKDDYERVAFANRSALRRWLTKNHERDEGIWLVSYKKHCGKRHLPYSDIVEEALCFGWIDSTVRRIDEDRSMLLLTPRKPGSPWSRSNKNRIKRLEKAGIMTPAGRAKIDVARRDGSWTILDDVEALEVPTDLAQALAMAPKAAKNYEAFSASQKKGILWWIKSAKKADTRARRISKTVEGLRKNRFPL